jgi:hypothetical protein
MARVLDSNRAGPNEGGRVLNVEEITRRRSGRSLSPVMPRDRRFATRVPRFEKPPLFQAHPSMKRREVEGRARIRSCSDEMSRVCACVCVCVYVYAA